VNEPAVRRKRDIAMVFPKNYALYPHMSVFENMAFGLQQHRHAEAEITERVQEVAATARARGVPLSQAQGGSRAGSASGCDGAWRSSVVPAVSDGRAALEPRREAARAVRARCRSLQRELGVTTLYVTHDQTEAMTMGDRVRSCARCAAAVASPHELFRGR